MADPIPEPNEGHWTNLFIAGRHSFNRDRDSILEFNRRLLFEEARKAAIYVIESLDGDLHTLVTIDNIVPHLTGGLSPLQFRHILRRQWGVTHTESMNMLRVLEAVFKQKVGQWIDRITGHMNDAEWYNLVNAHMNQLWIDDHNVVEQD